MAGRQKYSNCSGRFGSVYHAEMMATKKPWRRQGTRQTHQSHQIQTCALTHSRCQTFWCMGARLGPPQSTCSLASMHLTHGHYARSRGYRILAMCQMRKSEEPLVVHRSLTWWLIDVCSSLAILLAVHLARTTIEPLQRVSDKYRPTTSDQQEDLATLGSVQLRQTLALWTLASRLPRERPLLEMNGDILWTQQCSSRVRSKRRQKM